MNDRIRKADEFVRSQHAQREEQRAQIAAQDPTPEQGSVRREMATMGDQWGDVQARKDEMAERLAPITSGLDQLSKGAAKILERRKGRS